MAKLNGKELSNIEDKSIDEILKLEGYVKDRVAVELNYSIVPKAQYGEVIVKAGDTIEVVSFVGGG